MNCLIGIIDPIKLIDLQKMKRKALILAAGETLKLAMFCRNFSKHPLSKTILDNPEEFILVILLRYRIQGYRF